MVIPLLLTLFVGVVTSDDTPAAWSDTYSLQGVLRIPFAEVEEPFAAWADLVNRRSRIDYYAGMVKTFQIGNDGEYGTMAKVVPMTNEVVVNEISCFQVNGSKEEPVEAQSMLPDLSGFSKLGSEYKNEQECSKWQKKEEIGAKLNKYTMWTREVEGVLIPVFYEMRGFNTLLGSHYDHYYISYTHFSPEVPEDEVFNVYTGMTCRGWPGPGHEHTYAMQPMKEFIDNEDHHVIASFEVFKDRHSKEYRNKVEEHHRIQLFRQNMRFIHSKNRQGLSYKLAVNHLADRNPEEMIKLRGKIHDPNLKYNGGQEFKYRASEVDGLPESLDWRLYGAVTPVKDQSVCGSCWSFGTVGSLEGTLFLATGELVRLSQQALVDCSWGFGNNGCDGGEDFRAYQWMIKHGGIPTEDSYGPYLGQDGYCHLNQSSVGLKITGFVNVTSGDENALKVAIAAKGPISVAIDASHKSLSFYSSGVYYEEDCRSDEDGLDHAVLAVGYGTLGGKDYWLVKNSWSTYWGNDGYVLMARKNNNCGVTTSPTFAIPETP